MLTFEIQNNPNATPFVNNSVLGEDTTPAISHNRSQPLSYAGRTVNFSWESPGKSVSYNNSYVTSTSAGDPRVSFWTQFPRPSS